jgi:sporulation integral membrane protein YtvI
MDKYYAARALKFIVVCAVIIGFCAFFYFSFSYIYPILFAFILSYLLHPFVSSLEHKLKIPRFAATFFMMTAIFSIITLLLVAAIAEIYHGTVFLAEKVPDYFYVFTDHVESFLHSSIFPIYERILSLFSILNSEQQEAIQDSLNQFMDGITSTGTEVIQNILFSLPGLFSILPSSFTVVVFIILATFLMTNDWNKLKHTADKLLSKRFHDRLSTIIHHLKKALGGYFKAQLIMIMMTFILIFIGLNLIKVEHAFTIAILAAIVDLIPYAGIGILFIPWIIYSFIQSNYLLTIGLCLLYMFITILRQVLEPKILSANIGISPLATLIGMFFGIQIWGVAGLILAPFLLIILSACHQAGLTKWIWNYITG